MIDMQGKVQFPGRPARSALECVWLDTALVFPVRIDITEKREVNWVIPEVSAIKLEVSPNYVPFFKGVLWVGMKKKGNLTWAIISLKPVSSVDYS